MVRFTRNLKVNIVLFDQEMKSRCMLLVFYTIDLVVIRRKTGCCKILMIDFEISVLFNSVQWTATLRNLPRLEQALALDDYVLLDLTGTWWAKQRPANYRRICKAYIAGQPGADDVDPASLCSPMFIPSDDAVAASC